MGKEKTNYRSNLAKIDELYPRSGMLTVDEAAGFLNCNRRKVTALIISGKLPACDVGLGTKNSCWRISAEALARFCS